MPEEPRTCAAELYAMLHQMDAEGVEHIVVELPPQTDEWLAIWDRLQRAAIK
jgi:L-threonylcarbamoyladenylate synthase